MRKIALIVFLFLVTLVGVGIYTMNQRAEDLKLRMSRYWGYATLYNNPLLKPFDKDLQAINKDSRVSLSLLIAGGPPKDGIPAIDDPKFDTPATTSFHDDTTVVAVYYNGVAKAYPYPILNWHEVVNDTIGGLPISVTLCPLCDTNPVFVREIDERETSFGVSGKLFQSCLVMYDRLSDTLWSQPWGMGIAGRFTNINIKRIPGYKTTLGRWKKLHPDTLILSNKTGYDRDYDRYPYGSYEISDEIIFPVRNQERVQTHPKEIVSYIWKADGDRTKNRFDGFSHMVYHKEMKQNKVERFTFDDEVIMAKWDPMLETVRFFSTRGNREIPSSTAFAFVYFAYFD